jgi:hypothetical protein
LQSLLLPSGYLAISFGHLTSLSLTPPVFKSLRL